MSAVFWPSTSYSHRLRDDWRAARRRNEGGAILLQHLVTPVVGVADRVVIRIGDFGKAVQVVVVIGRGHHVALVLHGGPASGRIVGELQRNAREVGLSLGNQISQAIVAVGRGGPRQGTTAVRVGLVLVCEPTSIVVFQIGHIAQGIGLPGQQTQGVIDERRLGVGAIGLAGQLD